MCGGVSLEGEQWVRTRIGAGEFGGRELPYAALRCRQQPPLLAQARGDDLGRGADARALAQACELGRGDKLRSLELEFLEHA